ncbi:oligosaccharide flippase family protein [Vibrio cholerae]|uniref:oligosaccharide flippase family protein n=4 Tax=Vibrio cholerae TaxID=666 RepID=UPI00163BF23A|nr:oligosaccharide flippase family protein [Vibrio cholerae]
MFKNVVYLFGMQGVNYLIPLLTLPYLVRVLGPEYYGEYSFVIIIGQYCVMLTDFGFNLSSSAKIAKRNQDLDYICRVFTDTIYSKLCIGFIVSISVCILISYIQDFKAVSDLIIISLLQVLGCIFTPVWLFQGIERMKSFAILTVSSKLLCLPLIFIFVKEQSDINYAVAINACVFLLSGIISIYLTRSLGIKFLSIRIKDIFNSVRESSLIFIGTFSISLYTLSTPIILGLFSTSYEVGIFSAADKIRGALLGVFIILGNVFYPRVNNLLFSECREKGFNFIYKIIKYQFFISVIVSVLFFYMSPLIVKFYLGDKYFDSVILLKLMSPMIILIPMSVVLSNYILLPLGYKRYFSSIPVITSLIHIPCVIYFCRLYGALGASISILLIELLSFILLLLVNMKLGNISMIIKNRKEKI